MKTSIIILTYNKLDYTIQCIESIRLYTRPGTYEIIVVDNNSTDDTRAWLKQQGDVISILNENNVGFPRGCNQGIEIATGSNILLLNNDVIVTENWLDNMLKCLYSSDKIGAVSCVTNSCTYLQAIPVEYTNLESMQAFATQYNSKSNPSAWEERLKLIGFCMLIKKSVVDQIGLLDEIFSPGNYEDDDYSLRIRMAGYKLLLCRDTFIHHYGSTSFKENKRYLDLLKRNKNKFIDKWGFNPDKDFYFSPDIVELIELPIDTEFKLLEINCGCGGTLLKIKGKFLNSKLYGVETNESVAELSAKVAKMINADLDFNLIDCPEQTFDYIIISNSLQRFYDPNQIVSKMKRYLTPQGKLLMSVPNVMHHSVIKGLLNGEWTYSEYGVLDNENLRFFTLKEIYKMLLESGYSNLSIIGQNNGSKANPEWLESLSGVIDKELISQLDAYQYLVSASNNDIGSIIQELRVAEELSLNCLTKLNDFHIDEIFSNMELAIEADEVLQLLNKIGSWYFEKGDYKRVLPFFQKSLEINSADSDALYNVSYFLMFIGETEVATNYINQLYKVDQAAYNDLLMVLADF